MNLTRIKKISNLLSALLLLSAAVLLLICSDPVRKGVRDGLKSCAVVLIPSLFPFMVLSGILGESRAAESLQKILGSGHAPFFSSSRLYRLYGIYGIDWGISHRGKNDRLFIGAKTNRLQNGCSLALLLRKRRSVLPDHRSRNRTDGKFLCRFSFAVLSMDFCYSDRSWAGIFESGQSIGRGKEKGKKAAFLSLRPWCKGCKAGFRACCQSSDMFFYFRPLLNCFLRSSEEKTTWSC